MEDVLQKIVEKDCQARKMNREDVWIVTDDGSR